MKSSSTLLHGTPDTRYLSGHRFWTETVTFDSPLQPFKDSDAFVANLTKVLDHCKESGRRLDVGVVFAPTSGVMIPIHEGKLQGQHLTKLTDHFKAKAESKAMTTTKTTTTTSTTVTTPGRGAAAAAATAGFHSLGETVYVCGFSPRASKSDVSPNTEERPVDADRLECLNHALAMYEGMSVDLLLSEEYAGTPPARIYRSFIAPRPNAEHLLEPTMRAANRTATQIDLALRQVKADRALYLRNTDRSTEIADVEADSTVKRTVNPVILVLDNIRSAFNVGSLFRTAETAGCLELITCGITAHPPNPKLRKTAMAALEIVPTRHADDTRALVKELQEQGVFVVCLETTDDAKMYSDIEYPMDVPIALVVGNEVMGVDTDVMEAADVVAQIPTFGVKNSLNVAAALPVVLFEVIRQRQLHLQDLGESGTN